MYPDDSNPFTSSIIVKYENRPDNLNQVCLADFPSIYIHPFKTGDVPVEPDVVKSCTEIGKTRRALLET